MKGIKIMFTSVTFILGIIIGLLLVEQPPYSMNRDHLTFDYEYVNNQEYRFRCLRYYENKSSGKWQQKYEICLPFKYYLFR